jgi:hypothetical protein
LRISRCKHQESPLTIAPDENEAVSGIVLSKSTILFQSLNRLIHGASEVAARLYAGTVE